MSIRKTCAQSHANLNKPLEVRVEIESNNQPYKILVQLEDRLPDCVPADASLDHIGGAEIDVREGSPDNPEREVYAWSSRRGFHLNRLLPEGSSRVIVRYRLKFSSSSTVGAVYILPAASLMMVDQQMRIFSQDPCAIRVVGENEPAPVYTDIQADLGPQGTGEELVLEQPRSLLDQEEGMVDWRISRAPKTVDISTGGRSLKDLIINEVRTCLDDTQSRLRGLLITGPPGSGKSQWLRWIGDELLRNRHKVKTIGDISDRERVVPIFSQMFEWLKGNPGSAVVLDDVDKSFLQTTGDNMDDHRVRTAWLNGFESVSKTNVVIIATAEDVDNIIHHDDLLRTDRFSHIELKPLELDETIPIIENMLQRHALTLDDTINVETLAQEIHDVIGSKKSGVFPVDVLRVLAGAQISAGRHMLSKGDIQQALAFESS